MDKIVRELLFTPLSAGTLSAIIPDFCIELPSEEIRAPALLTCDEGNFKFTVHFMEGVPPAGLGDSKKKVLAKKDQIAVSGQINAEIAFCCRDVFPPNGKTIRGRGTSTIVLRSSKLELVPQKGDTLTSEQLESVFEKINAANPKFVSNDKKISDSPSPKKSTFHAHVIFHGQKLKIHDAETKKSEINDFLGEAIQESIDTHIFSGDGYEGALIEIDNELHLHLRSKENDPTEITDLCELTDRIIWSVGFTFGFHPWPTYRELRIDHKVEERWISPRLFLKDTFLAPVSESLGWSYFEKQENPIHAIIPTIAAGILSLEKIESGRIKELFWHVLSSDLSTVPYSTKILNLCAAIDGLMQVVTGNADTENPPGFNQMLKSTGNVLGLSEWVEKTLSIRKKYRNDFAHGRLWLRDENLEHMHDYAQLGCAFMTIIAARCGYEGPILADPFGPRQVIISALKNVSSTAG